MEGARAYIVVHVGSAKQINGIVVGELGTVDIRAVVLDMTAVIDVILGIHQANTSDPVPGFFSPVGICLVTCISSQSCTQVEEATIRNA